MIDPRQTTPGIDVWSPGSDGRVGFARGEITALVPEVRRTMHVVRLSRSGHLGLAVGGERARAGWIDGEVIEVLATLPPLYPEWLGDRTFTESLGVRFPYVGGEMANGIATTRMVIALGQAGMLGFFGAAGLPEPKVAHAIRELQAALGERGPWGVNLIHNPDHPAAEMAIAELLVRAKVPNVSASAFLGLTTAVVRCAAAGVSRDSSGRVVRARRIFAKVSRPEIAERFLEPPPASMLDELVAGGMITPDEAALQANLPVADFVTVEADSGGHTDSRPLAVIFPAIQALRDRISAARGYSEPPLVGAAGGLGTPASVASAFALGAAYVLTGSINQAAVESGLSELGRSMLAKADLADVAMAPAADMFEIGAKVQVLKRGTMFASRATRLHDLYERYGSLAELPKDVVTKLEKEIFRKPLREAVQDTRRFWQEHGPEQLARAEREPKHEMALVFRSYLGLASKWAVAGDAARAPDYQIWCGPAMGAFNRWAAGSFLEAPEGRHVAEIALNLLEGAAVLTRAHQLRSQGVPVPPEAFDFRPRPYFRG